MRNAEAAFFMLANIPSVTAPNLCLRQHYFAVETFRQLARRRTNTSWRWIQHVKWGKQISQIIYFGQSTSFINALELKRRLLKRVVCSWSEVPQQWYLRLTCSESSASAQLFHFRMSAEEIRVFSPSSVPTLHAKSLHFEEKKRWTDRNRLRTRLNKNNNIGLSWQTPPFYDTEIIYESWLSTPGTRI